MKENPEFLKIAAFAVELAKNKGADAAEAFISDSQSVQITVNNREAEQVNAVKDVGIGLRILKDQKMISGSSNNLAQDAIKELVEGLMKKVKYHTPDEFNVIPGVVDELLTGKWSENPDLLSYDTQIVEVPIQEKIKQAIKIETSGLDYDHKVVGTMMTGYQDSSSHIYLLNSNGISGWFPTSGCAGYTYLSASDGKDQQSGSYSKSYIKYNDFNPVDIGKNAAINAVNMLGAKPIKSCDVPLVISPEVSTELLDYIVNMLSADLVQKGKSLFAEKLNTEVGAKILTIIDDGKLKGGIQTCPVDGEGIPTQTTPLIVDGILKSYLYDCYTAKKGKVTSTGNRSRSNYQSSGRIGYTNLFIKPGNVKPKAIFTGIDKGFFLKEVLGLHGAINSTSGDFSIPCAGFMIEKGQITSPVRGITIGGNLFDLLKSVDKIGDDLTWFNNVGCPTILISSIKIGGTS